MSLGVVVIGRNEGERLVACLKSLEGVAPLVYVDSGSTDNSGETAMALGASVVHLDMSKPFSAARARNAGFERLFANCPDLEFVFFVDGDCLVSPTWVNESVARLRENTQLAVVCGRRKELAPEVSVYNHLCDMEWNTVTGPALACGGDAVYRVSVFNQVKGFDPTFIAGEEPELCFRIRKAGFQIERMDAEMTLHDAAMTRFGQWWKRTERSGHAYYLGWSKHGRDPGERYYRQDVRSIMFWAGLGILLMVSALLSFSVLPILLFLFIWILQAVRIYLRLPLHLQNYPSKVKFFYSSLLMLGKFPQALGVVRAWRKQWLGQEATLVEYK